MSVRFDVLVPGEEYERVYLAQLWGYKSHAAISRGIVTPSKDNCIILFVTHEKQTSYVPYVDYFEGDVLHMDGETNHANDERLLAAAYLGTPIHLFYRDRHHTPFTYFGPVKLLSHTLYTDKPSRFTFRTDRSTFMPDSPAPHSS